MHILNKTWAIIKQWKTQITLDFLSSINQHQKTFETNGSRLYLSNIVEG